MKDKKLTLKQEMFVNEYLIDLNATQSAIRAGYSKKTAKDIGCENLAKPNIAKSIQAGANKRIKQTKIDATWVLEQSKRVYERCMQDQAPLDIDGVKVGEYKFEHTGANKALENIGKHVHVNAFKGVDDDGIPIDHNWKVTFVDATEDAKPNNTKKA